MSSNKPWVLQTDPSIAKFLKKIPRNDAKRIVSAIESLSINPYAGDIQKMKGEENVWRRRVGSYRIFFEILPEKKIIHVFHAQRRTTQTY